MADGADQELVAAAARQVIAEVAPKELPLFRPLSQAYFKNPEKTLQGGSGKDQMLGFGAVEAATMLLTPVVLHSTQLAVHAVVTTLGGGLLTQFSRQFMITLSAELVKQIMQAFHTHAGGAAAGAAAGVAAAAAAAAPLMTPEQFAMAREAALQQLRDLVKDEEQAGRLADSIVAKLATGRA